MRQMQRAGAIALATMLLAACGAAPGPQADLATGTQGTQAPGGRSSPSPGGSEPVVQPTAAQSISGKAAASTSVGQTCAIALCQEMPSG